VLAHRLTRQRLVWPVTAPGNCKAGLLSGGLSTQVDEEERPAKDLCFVRECCAPDNNEAHWRSSNELSGHSEWRLRRPFPSE
jgi:hypothetical protein